MKREDASRLLRQMEQASELANEAETEADRRRYLADYRRMWKAIEPHVKDGKPYDDDLGQV